MIIEMRTYTVQPGSVATVEERFGQALPARAKLSPLAAFWHTEVGPLNRVIHVWAYDSFEERTRIPAESQKLEGWPPNIREFVTEQQSEIFLPAPFSPKLEPRQLGNLYEIRTYTLKPGGIPGVIDRWSTQIAERIKLSPLAGAWYSELGGLSSTASAAPAKKHNMLINEDAVARRQKLKAAANQCQQVSENLASPFSSVRARSSNA